MRRDRGKGSLREVEGIWRAQVYLGRDPLTGRPVYTSRRFSSRRSAEEWIRDQVKSRVLAPTRGSVGDLMDRWLANKGHQQRAGKLTANTLNWYANAIQKHLVVLAPLPAAKVTTADLQKFIDGKVDHLGKASLRRLVIVLRACFKMALEEGLIERTPAARLVVPKVESAAGERVWTVAQVRQFLIATSGTPLGPLWWLLAVSGLRRSEALGLRWSDIALPDIGPAVIDIKRAYVNVGGKPEYGSPKTDRSARRFTIDPETVTVLVSLKAGQVAAFGDDHQDWFPVFMRPDLKPINPDYVTKTFQTQARALGLRPIGPHGLRHSLATTLGEAGMPLLTVSRLLGHSSTRVTGDVYSHVFAETAGAAVALAAEVLRGE